MMEWSNWSHRDIIFRMFEENGINGTDMRPYFLVLSRFMTLIRDTFMMEWSKWSHRDIIFRIVWGKWYQSYRYEAMIFRFCRDLWHWYQMKSWKCGQIGPPGISFFEYWRKMVTSIWIWGHYFWFWRDLWHWYEISLWKSGHFGPTRISFLEYWRKMVTRIWSWGYDFLVLTSFKTLIRD